MKKSLRNRVLVILGIIAASLYFTFPLQKHVNLGLDLKGGMHVILQVETETLEDHSKKDAVLRCIEILRNRIDSMGVGETVIQQVGENSILVQLPGITDRETAKRMFGTTAKLEFHLVSDNPGLMKKALDGTIPKGFILKNTKDDDTPILLEETVAMGGDTVTDAIVDLDQTHQSYISLTFNGDGSKQFGNLTKDNVGRRLAIVMDGQVLSAPNINEPIMGGRAQITGRFTYEEASVLALSLRSGALPVNMHIEEERTIGPLLGQDSINSGISASVFGGLMILLFMVVLYLQAGVIAAIALSINLILIFGVMGFLNAMLPASPLTLTLPGIAGIILTLGMAVDANVLINERIREELNNERPLLSAINAGFDRALSAIMDSNITTLIAAFMLFQFGSGPIKGFAVTLSIGLICSLFTALYVSQTLFNLGTHFKIIKKLRMLKIFPETKFNFISKRYFCYALSSFLIIVSVIALIQKKDKAYGIDFVGGQIQEYRFEKAVSPDSIREALNQTPFADAVLQQFDQQPENVMIRTAIIDSKNINEAGVETQITSILKQYFPDNKIELLRVESVGPVVGKALQRAATLALILALGGILVYVGFRFKHFDFATAGVLALLHDVFITAGVLVIMDRQIDLLVVTALLTIAGYSINDTIVIYDRVRENLAKKGKSTLTEIINLSVNQTLSRTILTTLATMLVVISLYFKGGEVLNTFSLALLIGFISGTYSTVFIASPLVLIWEKKKRS
ncbi:MAG: protein translocase subunit SecD [Candidatus Omnitrophica bacterium]|nr:protein translocase subunit SecD [Candidatus Omnitrophota bacterium]